MKRGILLLLVASGLLGCSAMNQDARINFLEGQMKDVIQKSAQWDVTSRDVHTKLADYGAQMDTLREQVQVLTGRIEEMETGGGPRENPLFSQESLASEVRDLKERLQFLEGKVAELERGLGAVPPSAPTPPGGAPLSAVPPPVSTGPTVPSGLPPGPPVEPEHGPAVSPEQQAYYDAMDAMKQNQYEKAIRLFRGFISKSPGSDLSDNAQYWIGECYYAQKKYEEAIIEFEEVVQQYPNGDKVPSALLKEGLAFQEIKEKTPARQILKKLIDQYPNSEEAKIAQQKLKEM